MIILVALVITVFLWTEWSQNKWKDHVETSYEIHIYPTQYKMVIPADIQNKINGMNIHNLKENPLEFIKKLEREIETLPLIDNAEVYFDATGKIHIDAYQFKPVAYVVYRGEKKYLDRKGNLRNLSKHKNLPLPIVTGISDQKELKKIHRVLKELEKHPRLKSGFRRMEYKSGTISMKFSALSARVILGDTERIENKFRKLDRMKKALKKLKKTDRYTLLDLRYNGQVVCQKN